MFEQLDHLWQLVIYFWFFFYANVNIDVQQVIKTWASITTKKPLLFTFQSSLEFLLILKNSAGSDARWWKFKYILAVSRSVNTAVLGKNLCEGLISHWLPKCCKEFHLLYAMQVTSLIKAQFFLQPVKLKISELNTHFPFFLQPPMPKCVRFLCHWGLLIMEQFLMSPG